MPIIEFDNVKFTYDGTRNALDGISLRVEAGEFLCVLGGNGSGKSTLAKHVNALLTPDEGAVRVLDCDTRDASSVYHIRSNAGMVFQNPDDQIVASIIEDDVAFGPENLGVPNPELRDRVTTALEQVGLQGFEKRETSALSGGQKQRVAIAGALAMQPQILVFDEATAMLDPRGRAGLLRLCRELNETGFTIVYITHFMEEAARADRIVVLDEGRVALEGAPEEVLTEVKQLENLHLDVPFPARMSRLLQDQGMAVGMHISLDPLISDLRSKTEGRSHPVSSSRAEARSAVVEGSPRSGRPGKALIELQDVCFTYEPEKRGKRPSGQSSAQPKWGNDPNASWALQGISLDVQEGEFFGIAGHTGSGKSTLIQIAAGLLKPVSGQVSVNGVDLIGKRAAREASGLVGVVFQYPERQLFAATVFDDVAFGPRNLGLQPEEVEARVREALEMVHLDLEELRDKSPFALSGGQQRRVAIAGVLAMNPQALIMDEPTAGLDPQARASLLSLVSELHDSRQLTIVFVSHSMDDLARLCDRIALLNQGALIALGTPAEVFSNADDLKQVGLEMPHVLQLASALDIETHGSIPSETNLARHIAETARSARHGR